MVGGCVRDPLLGEPTSPDIDIVLEGDSAKLARWLFKRGISEIAPVIYSRFGTALVRVAGVNVEIASARTESYAPQSRKPTVRTATLEQDALRRDFTINTLFRNLHTGELFDVTGMALADIRDRVLRTPLDPALTFRDDPLRMLRAVRFKNRFNLSPVPELWSAISKEAHRLEVVSLERIRDEFSKMLLHKTAGQALVDLLDCGLLKEFAPELVRMVNVEQGSYHSKDVWGHTLDVIENSSRATLEDGGERLNLMLASLLHDVSKPETRTVEADQRVRFFGHERIGARTAARFLRKLRFPQKTVRAVSQLVANHMRLGSAVPFTQPAARRLIRDMGELTDLLVLLVECDAKAVGRVEKGIDFAHVRAQLSSVTTEGPKSELESPLSGEEIMAELNCGPGPTVGKAKRMLLNAVLDGNLGGGDKQAALELLRQTFH